jgi:hypothetical protein
MFDAKLSVKVGSIETWDGRKLCLECCVVETVLCDQTIDANCLERPDAVVAQKIVGNAAGWARVGKSIVYSVSINAVSWPPSNLVN